MRGSPHGCGRHHPYSAGCTGIQIRTGNRLGRTREFRVLKPFVKVHASFCTLPKIDPSP
jgi:hypothetical protein